MQNNNQRIGVLGYGEVGQAVAKFYKDPLVKDLNRDDGLTNIDVLNICIPWSDNFVAIAEDAIKKASPKITIIHSTVAPGTTQKLAQKFNGLVVHSPVRGVHPNLHEGIKTFVKYIGADDKSAGALAEEHLGGLGIKAKLFFPSAATELGKILDTTYYGVCIAWHGEMKKICDKFNVNFEDTVIDFNNTYNEGYKKLNMDNVIRPVLYPPENGIGGHCVIPNAEILKKDFSSLAIDLILEYKKKSL